MPGYGYENENEKATLVLEDGSVFEGVSWGYAGITVGEVVFNTSMTGYQEVLTDPSYAGQIVALTYPLVGNYGINADDFESDRIQVSGFVVREACESPSNFRSVKSLQDFLKEHRIVAIQGVDVRELTRKLRIHGVMMGALGVELSPEELLDCLRRAPRYDDIDFVRQVSSRRFYQWFDDEHFRTGQMAMELDEKFRVVAIDYGVKFNILRSLRERGCSIVVAPCRATVQQIMDWHPDGILLSNGPGDPALLRYAVETAQELMGKVPILGICLGHQILGWALGGRTFKLKFGHRGANHPVQDLRTKRVYITTQNHGYAVDENSLQGSGALVSHVNLNDATMEGLTHEELKILSVQYHPEASPGPRDNSYIFEEFVQLLEMRRQGSGS